MFRQYWHRPFGRMAALWGQSSPATVGAPPAGI